MLPNGDIFMYIKSATEDDNLPFSLPEAECTRVDVEGKLNWKILLLYGTIDIVL